MAKARCEVCGKSFKSKPALAQHRRGTGHGKHKLLLQPKFLTTAGIGALVIVVGAIIGWSVLSGGSLGPNSADATVGAQAPAFTFTTVDGASHQLADFQGQRVMLWFIATWCPTCQAASEAISDRITELERSGLQIVTLKLHNNLGRGGPGIAAFGKRHAGSAYDSPNWLWGNASQWVSFTYDPTGAPDIYWLIDEDGILRAQNTAPHTTMGQIMRFARGP